MTDMTDNMVEEVLQEAEKNYINCPSYSTGDVPDFSRFVAINTAIFDHSTVFQNQHAIRNVGQSEVCLVDGCHPDRLRQ